jgi:hypothetical protein
MCFFWPCPKRCRARTNSTQGAKLKSQNEKLKAKVANPKWTLEVERKKAVKRTARGTVANTTTDPEAPLEEDRLELVKEKNLEPIDQKTSTPVGKHNKSKTTRSQAQSLVPAARMDEWPNIHPLPSHWAHSAAATKRSTVNDCDCDRCREVNAWHEAHVAESVPERDETVPEHSHTANHHSSPSENEGQSLHVSPAAPSIKSNPTVNISATAPSSLHPAFMAYPQIYVCPRSAAHLSFPVVDYSRDRWDPVPPWPHFYMAIAPDCASLGDLRTTLAPKGSGLRLGARSLEDGSNVEITRFGDITELRCRTIQLEVWGDEWLSPPMKTGKHAEKKSEKGKTSMPFCFPPGCGDKASGKKPGKDTASTSWVFPPVWVKEPEMRRSGRKEKK